MIGIVQGTSKALSTRRERGKGRTEHSNKQYDRHQKKQGKGGRGEREHK